MRPGVRGVVSISLMPRAAAPPKPRVAPPEWQQSSTMRDDQPLVHHRLQQVDQLHVAHVIGGRSPDVGGYQPLIEAIRAFQIWIPGDGRPPWPE